MAYFRACVWMQCIRCAARQMATTRFQRTRAVGLPLSRLVPLAPLWVADTQPPRHHPIAVHGHGVHAQTGCGDRCWPRKLPLRVFCAVLPLLIAGPSCLTSLASGVTVLCGEAIQRHLSARLFDERGGRRSADARVIWGVWVGFGWASPRGGGHQPRLAGQGNPQPG